MLRRFLFLLALLASLTAAQANEHSGVLEQLPFISDEEFEQAAPLTGSAPLTLDGSPLPYDKETNTYYLPVSKEEALAERSLHLENAPGVSYSLWDPGDGSVRLCALSADGMRTASLVFTTLPVLELETASGMLPEDDVQRGTLTQLTGDGGQLKIEQSEVEINLRGNTSRRLPKKSYRVKIIENDGQKKDLSIAGLRSDDDWIFNPMYSDTSKIREPLGYWLWDQMNSVGQEAASSRSAYAEVLINGSCWNWRRSSKRSRARNPTATFRSG